MAQYLSVILHVGVWARAYVCSVSIYNPWVGDINMLVSALCDTQILHKLNNANNVKV